LCLGSGIEGRGRETWVSRGGVTRTEWFESAAEGEQIRPRGTTITEGDQAETKSVSFFVEHVIKNSL